MKLIKFIWGFVRDQKWLFSGIIVFSHMWLIETLYWPFFLGKVIDILTTHDIDRMSAWPQLKPLFVSGIIIWLIMDGGFRLRDFLQARAFPQLESNIRISMFDHVQHHSPKYFNEHFSGSLANKISDMALMTTIILRTALVYFLPAGVILAVAVIIFAQMNAILALIVGVWIVLHLTLCWFFTLKCGKYAYIHGAKREELVGKIVDSLTNNFAVNLFYRFQFEKQHIAKYQNEELKANRVARLYPVKMFTSLSIALAIATFVLTGFIIFYWIHGNISTGEVVQGLYTIWNVSLIFFHIADKCPEFFHSIGIAKQALTVMEDPQDIGDLKGAKDLKVNSGEIIFENVSFHYGERELFQNKHVHISGSEKIGLVGFTGAGKSTFINLILRLFPLHSGKILIDGQEIATVTLESIRNQIGLIPQDPILFHRTLRENISYGKPGATEEEIINAAKLAHCHEFICNIPGGYSAKVGERGTKLSGGERQRIAIARAILVGAPILILDEATSALDSVTEKYIQDSLDKLMQNRTTIAIAHRLSTLSRMDRILVFDKGKIVEEGTHISLLEKNGLYTKMWNMQAGGFLPDEPV